MIGVLVKMIICGILARVIVNAINVKLINIYILKIIHEKNRLFGNLVLECKDEIFKTSETLLNDKKVTRGKVIALFTLFHYQ